MLRSHRLLPSLFLASSLTLFALPAVASPPCSPMEGTGYFPDHHRTRLAAHHKKLHTALKLDSKQETAWNNLVDAERPMARSAPDRAVDWDALSTPERVERMQARMQTQQATLAEYLVVLKAFYAGLTPTQQRTFDDFHHAPRRNQHGKR